MKDNMSNLIEDLFHGNLRLDESIHPEQAEYQEINRQISDMMQLENKASRYRIRYFGATDRLDWAIYIYVRGSCV
ncbi:DUF6809 family protein [Paenibacillus illinoisensis]|uniref:Uncharacterized protein n=1 Tax=Paenibacillus illinoisensis TaxID=59845 RepID=A0A2W0CFX6_9BACL|nr:DUF6809 family protein [Paenibacillus illinoisensis]PYY28962.1 Uncharacterized protein PIL02S_02934 [Paenibacillus illinoisensis]